MNASTSGSHNLAQDGEHHVYRHVALTQCIEYTDWPWNGPKLCGRALLVLIQNAYTLTLKLTCLLQNIMMTFNIILHLTIIFWQSPNKKDRKVYYFTRFRPLSRALISNRVVLVSFNVPFLLFLPITFKCFDVDWRWVTVDTGVKFLLEFHCYGE